MPRDDPANRPMWDAMAALGRAYPSILVRKDGKKAGIRRQMQILSELFPDSESLEKGLLDVIGSSAEFSRIKAAVEGSRNIEPL